MPPHDQDIVEKTETSSLYLITPKQAPAEIACCFRAKPSIVPYLTSAPGIGKSRIFADMATKAKRKLIDIRLSTAAPEDLSGFPITFKDAVGRTIADFIPFKMFPLRGQPLPLDETGDDLMMALDAKYIQEMKQFEGMTVESKGENLYFQMLGKKDRITDNYNMDKNIIREKHELKGWLMLLDELSSANKMLQTAAYKIMLDHKVGQYDLHPDLVIGAAGNRMQDKSVVFEMSQALGSRMAHFELEPDLDSWVDWAIDFGINIRITSFVSSFNSFLCNFDPDAETLDRTFACPRTWEMLNRLIESSNEDVDDLPLHRIASVIGSEAAVAFKGYCDNYKHIPSFKEIVDFPTTTKIPTVNTQAYAVADMCASHSKLSQKNIDAVLQYIERLPTDIQSNFIFFVSKLAVPLEKTKDGKLTPFYKLAAQIQAVIQE